MEDNNERNDNQGEAGVEEFRRNENHDNPGDEGDDDENEGGNNNNNNNNNNNMIDIDLEEDEEDIDNDSTHDGGVAANPEAGSEDPASKPKKHSSECDLLLYIYCQEPIDVAPDHPILRPGVTVSIGLDKTTKLKAVFRQYVDFCNFKSKSNDIPKIGVDDLEFSFSQLLNENDTAETSALMKNDRIRVRKVRTYERQMEAERKRMQRESDRMYFQVMRHLLPESCPTRVADVILDCRGKLVDNKGRNQRVLSTTVRAHSSMIRKRCPWLMGIIQKARQEAKRKFEEDQVRKHETPDPSSTRATEIENDEDGDNCNSAGRAISSSSNEEQQIRRGEEEISRGAAQIDMVDDSSDDEKVNVIIVDDDDEDDSNHVVSSAQHQIPSRPEIDVLSVVLSDHSPEAVKILLEYCYTNRVVSLGHNAFVQACKTRPNKHNGPVPPYPTTHSSIAKRWPSNGIPVITFSVALAAIKLAEEAGMYRLSFMCEIAAAQLVTKENIVEALTMSTRQKIVSGNDLPRLRKSAMEVLLRRGRRGVSEIGRTSCFKKALDEDRSVIVPSLLQGTMEAVSQWEKAKGAKRDLAEVSLGEISFKDIDREDYHKRILERKRRRLRRTDPNKIGDQDDDILNDLSDDPYDDPKNWATLASAAAERSLSGMAGHNLDSLRRKSYSRGGGVQIDKPSKKRSSRSRSRSDGFFGNREK